MIGFIVLIYYLMYENIPLTYIYLTVVAPESRKPFPCFYRYRNLY